MNREEYDLIPDMTGTRFHFFSKGPKGVIWKAIHFQNMDGKVYNLSFGDWDKSLEKIDDLSRSDNRDRQKLFNTVASAVLKFLNNYPEARIIINGSTPARKRLYQIVIKANLTEIDLYVKLYGYRNGEWLAVERHRNYDVFMVSKVDFFYFK